MAGLAGIAGKGIQGYLQGRAIKRGEEQDAKDRKRQATIDKLNEERVRASMANERTRIDLRRQELERADRRFDATFGLRQDRFGLEQEQFEASQEHRESQEKRATETHDLRIANAQREQEQFAAVDKIKSGVLAQTLADQQRNGGDLSDYLPDYTRKISEGILMTTGDLALASQWEEYATSKEAEQTMEKWDKARFALEGGDFDTAIDLAADIYNEHIPDGYSVDKENSGIVRDSQGNILHAAVRFTGPDGQVSEQVFDDVQGFFNQVLPMIDPAAAFEARIAAGGRADKFRAEASAEVRERLSKARDEAAKMIRENAVSVNPQSGEQLREAIVGIYRQYGLDEKGRLIPQGEERDVEAEAPFSGLR